MANTYDNSIVVGTWSRNGTLTHVDEYDKTTFYHEHPSICLFTFLPNGKVQEKEICIECAYIDKSIGGTYEMLSDDTVFIKLFSLQ